MQLLVSVRSSAEARVAAVAGADVVDAKEPAHGALGAVSPATLLEISARVPAGTGLSAAAGEGGPGELLAALEQVPLLPRRHAWLKFAVRGPVTPDAGEGMTAATAYLAGRPDHPRLVVGRYADESLDDVEEWIELAARAGVAGLLLDTRRKDAGSLLDVASVETLRHVRNAVAARGLWLGLAGRLSLDEVATVAAIGPDVIGVRGAACDGGRTGEVAAGRVRALVDALRRGSQPAARSATRSAVTTET